MSKNNLPVEPAKAAPAPASSDADKQGCATSFINREKDATDKLCGTKPDPKKEYVQPESEKEFGGEG